METTPLKTIKAVHEYILSEGWTLNGGKPPSLPTVKKAIQQDKLRRQKNGFFLTADVDKYAALNMVNEIITNSTTTVKDEIEREKLRKLQIENDKKSGELVSLSEEIKRRVAVIQGFKSAMINGKATFARSLRDSMKQRHPESEALDALLADAAGLYESAVLDCFDDICKRGSV